MPKSYSHFFSLPTPVKATKKVKEKWVLKEEVEAEDAAVSQVAVEVSVAAAAASEDVTEVSASPVSVVAVASVEAVAVVEDAVVPVAAAGAWERRAAPRSSSSRIATRECL